MRQDFHSFIIIDRVWKSEFAGVVRIVVIRRYRILSRNLLFFKHIRKRRLIVKKMSYGPLLVIDNLLRTLILVGAILIASIIIAHPNSWATNAAMIGLLFGFLSFVLASQFLVTIEMEDEETITVHDKARDPRLAIPFFFGYLAYIAAGSFICFYFVTS